MTIPLDKTTLQAQLAQVSRDEQEIVNALNQKIEAAKVQQAAIEAAQNEIKKLDGEVTLQRGALAYAGIVKGQLTRTIEGLDKEEAAKAILATPTADPVPATPTTDAQPVQ